MPTDGVRVKAYPLPMRIFTIVALLAVLCLSTPGSAGEGKAPTPDGATVLSKLGYLTGTWSGPMWGGTFRAQYGAPSGDTLLSYSRLYRDEKMAFYEFEVFEVVDRKLILTPYPGGKPAASFTLTSFDEGSARATFESPKNDFPSAHRIPTRRQQTHDHADRTPPQERQEASVRALAGWQVVPPPQRCAPTQPTAQRAPDSPDRRCRPR